MPAPTWQRLRFALGCALPGIALGCTNQTVVSLLERPALSSPDAAGGSTDAAGGSTDAGGGGADAAGGSAGMDAATSDRRLIHRYSFSGTGTVAVDSIGGADGTILAGATLDGAGHLPLDGVDDYVSLPSGLIHTLSAATIVAWLDWGGGGCWQRLFDFGVTDMGKDLQGTATSELYSTPLRCPGTGPTLAYSTKLYSDAVDSNTPFPAPGRFVPITVILDAVNGQMALYVDGGLLGTNTLEPLSAIDDQTAWLARSLWVQDLNLHGSYDEFRIYNYAFTDANRARVEADGPDVATVP